jgi:hypothetical protein
VRWKRLSLWRNLLRTSNLKRKKRDGRILKAEAIPLHAMKAPGGEDL